MCYGSSGFLKAGGMALGINEKCFAQLALFFIVTYVARPATFLTILKSNMKNLNYSEEWNSLKHVSTEGSP